MVCHEQIVPHDLISPPNEFGVMPFWFWNDDLDAGELVRQIGDFEAHGVGGFVIHPRVGLPRSLPWMSDALLEFYEVAVAEARRRGMKVMLYDEGMYPSGSSCGQVVATNPDYQCRCIAIKPHRHGMPYALKEGEHLVAIVNDEEGTTCTIIDRKLRSAIRGLHYDGEGPQEDAPPAADLLNPDAVDCFVDLVYRRFYERFRPYWGTTIVGIFTDEPSLMGRPGEHDVFPGTTGILDRVNELIGTDFTPRLADLWSSDDAKADDARQSWHSACAELMEGTYYSRLSRFCRERGIALAGHPHGAMEIGILRHFDIPGQDMVWRWVLPDDPTALEGAESTQAKCSASAMVHAGKRRNLNECCGAYGHELTWEEMTWIANWCVMRGVNLLVPHAFYYSMRGCRRDERPPDVGPHAPWWAHYKEYADAVRRLCWINTDSQHECHVAILGTHNQLPWRAAKVCYEYQIDFNYLDERGILEEARVVSDGVHVRGMHYAAIVMEAEPGCEVATALLPLKCQERLLRYGPSDSAERLVIALRSLIPPSIVIDPPDPGIRVRQVQKEGRDYVMLFRETHGDGVVTVNLPSSSGCHVLNIASPDCEIQEVGQGSCRIRLESYQLKVLVS